MEPLGRYEIIEEIGRGAMGIVYRGSDPKINRTVALKCLHAALSEGDEGVKRRFQQEMRALGRLIHPNIVTIFDAGEDTSSERAYIVMEFVEGISLSQLLKEEKPLSIDQVVQIGIQICRGLDFAHKRGVIHRDIKPGNILLSNDFQELKIADFGIARLDNAALTQTDRLTGTPQYMSPEQCRGETLNGRSDLFAVGALLYELLTRKKAFQGDSITAVMHQILNRTPYPPSIISGEIPESLSGIVMKALEKEADHRFESGEKMADALLTVIEESRRVSLTEEIDETKVLSSMEVDKTKELHSMDPLREDSREQSTEKRASSWSRYAVLISVFFVLAIGIFVVLRKPSPKSGPSSAPHIAIPAPKDFPGDKAIEDRRPSLPKKETVKSGGEKSTPEQNRKKKTPEPKFPEKELVVKEEVITVKRVVPPPAVLVGQVLFSTTPSGADIVINGDLKGISPISIELPAGPHELAVVKKGYHSLEATIDVPAGEKTPINLKLLEEEKR